MGRCRQGSARPRDESSTTPDDTPGVFMAPDRVAVSQLDGCAPSAAELDPRLFHGPFVLLTRDNECCGVVETAAAAWAALAERADVASIVGTLHGDFEAVDIDPADRPGTDPIVGQALAEHLVTWATRNGFPWLVRESGRPGGFHAIIRVPESHTDELRQVVRDLARPFGDRTAIASVRRPRTLRLLGAPHRHGHPSPISGGTLRPADIAPRAAAEDPRPAEAHRPPSRRQTGRYRPFADRAGRRSARDSPPPRRGGRSPAAPAPKPASRAKSGSVATSGLSPSRWSPPSRAPTRTPHGSGHSRHVPPARASWAASSGAGTTGPPRCSRPPTSTSAAARASTAAPPAAPLRCSTSTRPLRCTSSGSPIGRWPMR